MALAGSKLSKKQLSEAKQKLIVGFSRGYNILECCLYSGISHSTYYKYFGDDQEALNEFKLHRQNLKLKAKEVINDSLNDGDVNTAKYILDRTSDEFKPKSEQDIKGELEVSNVSQETAGNLSVDELREIIQNK